MKTIIAGIDFTQSSYNAARYAAMLAVNGKSKLTLFNMFEVPLIHSNSGLYFMSYNAIRDGSSTRLKKFREKLQEEFPKLKIDFFVAAGSFRNELERFIDRHRVQSVVLGLGAKNRFSKFLYGSHTTDIAGRLSAPVIIVPEQYKVHKLGKLTLCVDNREKLQAASLRSLENLMMENKSALQVLHVRTKDEIFESMGKQEVKVAGKKYPVEVVNARDLETGVKRYSLAHKPQLIAIISHKHSAFYKLFNETNTKNIAFSSKVPVMAIHE